MAPGHAVLTGGFQVFPECAGIASPAQGFPVELNRSSRLRRRVIKELDAKVPRASLHQPGEVLGGRLRDRVVERVPAPDIGHEWMIDSYPIAQLHDVGVAGTAAV